MRICMTKCANIGFVWTFRVLSQFRVFGLQICLSLTLNYGILLLAENLVHHHESW
jgi:hypothetical protein